MTDYLDKLEKARFCRIHKQTIINLEQVVFFNGEQVVMTDQQEWKVSRNMKRELKQRMMNGNGL